VDGQLAVIHLLNGSRTVTFPAIALGVESVYYLTAPMPDHEDSSSSNGPYAPGCNNVKALGPAAGPPVDGSLVNGSNSAYFFYDCNINHVDNTRLPPLNAAVAAQAIVLSGQIHLEFTSTAEEYNQFVAYNLGLPFGEPQNNSATGMASLISRFAIGVISAAAQTNPPMFLQGSLPKQGVRLQLDSFWVFNLILIIMGTLQFILVLLTAVVVSRLVVSDEVLLSH